jgi:CelD/BcsL family acetyltransferase involved in cellulose biosynthesis
MGYYRCLQPSELTASQLDRWSDIASCRDHFQSPYFRPEFTLAVAAVRNDVRVVVAGDPQCPAAFWPFQVRRGGTGIPVGGPLNDVHGIIAVPEFQGDPAEMLDSAGLKRWYFHQLAPSQSSFLQPENLFDEAPYVALHHGLDKYTQTRRKRHGRTFKDLDKRQQRLTDELGELRFEWQIADPQMLDQLIDWKRSQYRRTQVFDVFSVPWTGELLHNLLRQQTVAMTGQLSVLYAGDVPVAMHFGMRSGHVLHCWYPAYDDRFAKWSPGLQAFDALIGAASRAGVERLDLGKGPEAFKRKLSNGCHTVASGVAGSPRGFEHMRSKLRRAATWIRQSSLGTPVKQVLVRICPQRGKSAFQ